MTPARATPSSRARFRNCSCNGPSPAIVKVGGRILRLKFGEGAQTGLEPFLLDQPAGLHKFPRTVVRPGPRLKRNFGQRNAGAMKANLLRRDSRAPATARASDSERTRTSRTALSISRVAAR